jgi:rhodanese-related sulfurtransferase
MRQKTKGAGRAVGRLLAAALIAATLGLAAAAAADAGELLSAPDALARAEAGALVLIDIRTPAEWRKTGVAAHAKPVTLHHPKGPRGFLADILKLTGGDRSKPIALICAHGNRSARARRFLEANGFTHVDDVSEGMMGRGDRPGWLARHMPVTPCPVC